MLHGEIRERARRSNSAPPMPTRAAVVKSGVPVVTDLIDGLSRPRLCDLSFKSKDGIIVKAPRFMLGIQSQQLETLLYDVHKDESDLSCFEGYSSLVLNAMLEYCVSGELNDSPLAQHESSATARELVHLASFSEKYGLNELFDEVFKIARILMNKREPLAAAFYDESASLKLFERYALQIFVDSPHAALMDSPDPGICHLSSARLIALIQDQSFEIEEMLAFQIVLQWLEQSEEENAFDIARQCCQFLHLEDIEPLDLLTTVRESRLVDGLQILHACANQAVAAQRLGIYFSQPRGPGYFDRLLVTGAGKSGANGLYHARNEDDDGMKTIYLKTSERNGGDFGVFIWGKFWNLAPAVDLSNVCYSVPINEEIPGLVPTEGWKTKGNGTDPAPSLRLFRAKRRIPSILPLPTLTHNLEDEKNIKDDVSRI